MTGKISLLGGTAALTFFIISTPVRSADYSEPGCTLSGSVMAGIMYDWQEIDEGDIDEINIDWTTPFGEGAGLVTCGGLNIQADIAHYSHSGDRDFDDEEDDEADLNRSSSHIGGALFYRDPTSWAAGLQASWISQGITESNMNVFRAGVFGEVYLADTLTLGAMAAYHDSDSASDLSMSGYELAAYARFYATPDFSIMLRGDFIEADSDFFDESGELDGYAVTGEAEYLVWNQGLSLIAGARYAERDHVADFGQDFSLDSTDTQIFGGIKFYFGDGGTLMKRQRLGPIDNTSVFEEKLPNTLFDFPA